MSGSFGDIISGVMQKLGMSSPDTAQQYKLPDLPAEPAPPDTSPVPPSAFAQQELRSATPLQDEIPPGVRPGTFAWMQNTPEGRQHIQDTIDNTLSFGPAAIKAFHGSPHLFDKFSMDNLGGGEGSQVRGRGLYFADKQAPTRKYTKVPGQTTPGHTYEVNLDVEPEQLLDWDKPVGEQAPHIQEFAKNQGFDDHLNMTGEDVYEELIGKHADPRIPRYQQTGVMDKATSELADAGIPGITYFDPSSPGIRGDGRGYVMLRDNLINIMRTMSGGKK